MPITLQKIRARKKMRERALEKALERIRKQLLDMGALKIVLFGSYARNQVTSWSDLDILAVMPSTKTGKEWMSVIYSEVERSIGCDIIAYTNEELENAIPLSRFLRHALETGRVIYEKGSEG